MRRVRFLTLALLFGYAFLYIPIALLVGASFNASRLTTVWTGFSWRWYAVLWADQPLMSAAWLSLRIAAAAATGATALGTLAGYALARLGRFWAYGLYRALLAVPLVLPDVLIGLSLLLLFVAMEQASGWPERGAGTIVLAHVTYALSYVAAVVQGRLADAGTDLEEAAMDLGATPVGAFVRVTLPLLAPAVVSGWLLAFTLSLDDLVVASFTSGPGASTLPMALFSTLRLGTTPELNALATVMLAAVALVLFGGRAARRWRPERAALNAARAERDASAGEVRRYQPHTPSPGGAGMVQTSGIREHMEVIGADGGHVGTVDKVEGDRIKLTRGDRGSGGAHHFIPVSLVEEVDADAVRLSMKAELASQFWQEG